MTQDDINIKKYSQTIMHTYMYISLEYLSKILIVLKLC
jgi:hypothetical protein